MQKPGIDCGAGDVASLRLQSAATLGFAAIFLTVALAGCAESPVSNAGPLRIRSSQATPPAAAGDDVELGTDTRVVQGAVRCSVANRFFWFPDTTRSCGPENAKTLTIPRNAVRIDVEVSWVTAQPAARNLTLVVSAADGSVELDRISGPSSLHARVGERAARNHYADGGFLRVQVDAATGILGADYDADVAAALVQDYTLVLTTTYES